MTVSVKKPLDKKVKYLRSQRRQFFEEAARTLELEAASRRDRFGAEGTSWTQEKGPGTAVLEEFLPFLASSWHEENTSSAEEAEDTVETSLTEFVLLEWF